MTVKKENALPKSVKKKPLTNRQKLFVQEYLIDCNAYQAALRAGYSKTTAARNAYTFFANPLIKAAIHEAMTQRCQRTGITQDRVLQELAAIAFSDLRDVAEWSEETLTLKPSSLLTTQQASLICEISTTATTNTSKTKIKRHDKMKALELIMRHMGMFTDKLSHSGGVNISLLEQARERAKKTP